jgi:hypothetical protein
MQGRLRGIYEQVRRLVSALSQGLKPKVHFAVFTARDPDPDADPEGAPVPLSCPDTKQVHAWTTIRDKDREFPRTVEVQPFKPVTCAAVPQTRTDDFLRRFSSYMAWSALESSMGRDSCPVNNEVTWPMLKLSTAQ